MALTAEQLRMDYMRVMCALLSNPNLPELARLDSTIMAVLGVVIEHDFDADIAAMNAPSDPPADPPADPPSDPPNDPPADDPPADPPA